MLSYLNNKINFSFGTEIPKEKADIIALLKEKSASNKWYSALIPGQIDYTELKFLDTGIEVTRMPHPLFPFRPIGKIIFTFNESKAKTKVKCDVIVGNNSTLLMMALQSMALLIGAFFWIVWGWRLDNLNRYGMPVGAFIVFNGISVIKIVRDRRQLIDYAYTIIKRMRA